MPIHVEPKKEGSFATKINGRFTYVQVKCHGTKINGSLETKTITLREELTYLRPNLK